MNNQQKNQNKSFDLEKAKMIILHPFSWGCEIDSHLNWGI